jgi:hypothetical protein
VFPRGRDRAIQLQASRQSGSNPTVFQHLAIVVHPCDLYHRQYTSKLVDLVGLIRICYTKSTGGQTNHEDCK